MSETSAAQALYTVEEVAESLAIGRTKVFSLLKSGELRSLKIGRNRRISAAQLEDFVESLPPHTGRR